MDNKKDNSEASALAYASLMNKLDGKIPISEMKIDPEVSKKIAEAYANLQHDPENPAVKKAYDALINETKEQYKSLLDKGLKVSKINKDMGNPYSNSKELIKDIGENKHMWYFPTESGFGSGVTDTANHPMLRPTDILDPEGKPMLANDLFRVVHDYEGHYKGNNKFGALGEERAYQQHKKMFSPEAVKALTTETRGQNSWVNYGPLGEQNRKNPANTTYADQKAGILPDWAAKDVPEIKSPVKHNLKKAGLAALKFGLPAAALAAASQADTLDEGILDLIIPGGLSKAGQSKEEEDMMLAESKALLNYKKARAKKDALQRMIAKEKDDRHK